MKIIKIEEVFNYKESKDSWYSYSGYRIITDTGDVALLISDEQSCCENWGYITSADDFEDFIGTEILKIEKVDTAYNKKVIEAVKYIDEGGAVFLNIETHKGLLQFAVYNGHNGYYGHKVLIKFNDSVEEAGI